MNPEGHLRTPINDDYGTCRETWAELRLSSASLSLPEVAVALAIDAAELEIVRPMRPSRHVFALSSREQVFSRDLRRHLDWLMAKLEGRAATLAALGRQGQLDSVVFCPWHGEGGGPAFWPAQMKAVAALGLDLVLDYVDADPDSRDD